MTAAAYEPDHEERRTYIGASDAAAALGLSPWGDPIGLAMEKWGERPPREFESFRMKLGKVIEPVIGTLYREETGALLRAGGSRTRRMKGHPWIGAHPDFYRLDGIRSERGLVQAKLSYSDFDGGIPLHYRVQALTELAVTGAPWLDFAVLEARSFRIFRVEPEPGEVEDLVADLDDYWNGYIVPKILPEPSAASTEALHERYRSGAKGIGKLASAAQVEKIQHYRRLGEEIKALQENRDLIGNEIRAAIGSASFLEGDGYKATWSRWESDKVAWDRVAAVHAESVDTLLAILDRIREDDPNDWAMVDTIRSVRDAAQGLYTTKEPGHRLTVSAPKEDKA